MTDPSSPHTLPTDLPVPEDDGAAVHLIGAALPDLELPSTSGGLVSIGAVHGPEARATIR